MHPRAEAVSLTRYRQAVRNFLSLRAPLPEHAEHAEHGEGSEGAEANKKLRQAKMTAHTARKGRATAAQEVNKQTIEINRLKHALEAKADERQRNTALGGADASETIIDEEEYSHIKLLKAATPGPKKDGAKAGDARVFAAEARAASETSDEGTETRADGSNRTVFFSLALPLPSYAVRHVLDAKGVVAKLHMSRGGASGWAEYAAADDAAAAVAALDGTEILGIEFRVAATRPEGDALTGPEGAERLGDDASEGSERHEAGAETNVFETNALETRAGEREGVAAKKRARIAATAGS